MDKELEDKNALQLSAALIRSMTLFIRLRGSSRFLSHALMKYLSPLSAHRQLTHYNISTLCHTSPKGECEAVSFRFIDLLQEKI